MVAHGFRDRHVAVAAYHIWEREHWPLGRDKTHWRLAIDELAARWHAEFPRFTELYRDIADKGGYDGWFTNLPSKAYSCLLATEWFENREAELADLQGTAWDRMSRKIVQNSNGNRQQLINFLNEAAGYSYLRQTLVARRIAFDNIDEPVLVGKQPEWEASYQGRTVAAVEVKTVKFPGNEANGGWRVYPTIPPNSWNKLRRNVARAKSQLNAIESGRTDLLRIAYIIVPVDYEQSQCGDNKGRIATFLESKSDTAVEVAHDIRMWPYDKM